LTFWLVRAVPAGLAAGLAPTETVLLVLIRLLIRSPRLVVVVALIQIQRQRVDLAVAQPLT
jgi:uncharacterized membrane protein